MLFWLFLSVFRDTHFSQHFRHISTILAEERGGGQRHNLHSMRFLTFSCFNWHFMRFLTFSFWLFLTGLSFSSVFWYFRTFCGFFTGEGGTHICGIFTLCFGVVSVGYTLISAISQTFYAFLGIFLRFLHSHTIFWPLHASFGISIIFWYLRTFYGSFMGGGHFHLEPMSCLRSQCHVFISHFYFHSLPIFSSLGINTFNR